MPNKEIPGIIQELEDLATEQSCDAFILYLYILSSLKTNSDLAPHEYETIKQKTHLNRYYGVFDYVHIFGVHGKNSLQ